MTAVVHPVPAARTVPCSAPTTASPRPGDHFTHGIDEDSSGVDAALPRPGFAGVLDADPADVAAWPVEAAPPELPPELPPAVPDGAPADVEAGALDSSPAASERTWARSTRLTSCPLRTPNPVIGSVVKLMFPPASFEA